MRIIKVIGVVLRYTTLTLGYKMVMIFFLASRAHLTISLSLTLITLCYGDHIISYIKKPSYLEAILLDWYVFLSYSLFCSFSLIYYLIAQIITAQIFVYVFMELIIALSITAFIYIVSVFILKKELSKDMFLFHVIRHDLMKKAALSVLGIRGKEAVPTQKILDADRIRYNKFAQDYPHVIGKLFDENSHYRITSSIQENNYNLCEIALPDSFYEFHRNKYQGNENYRLSLLDKNPIFYQPNTIDRGNHTIGFFSIYLSKIPIIPNDDSPICDAYIDQMLYEEMVYEIYGNKKTGNTKQLAYTKDGIVFNVYKEPNRSIGNNFTYLIIFFQWITSDPRIGNEILGSIDAYCHKIKIKYGIHFVYMKNKFEEINENLDIFQSLSKLLKIETLLWMFSNQHKKALEAYSDSIFLRHFGLSKRIPDPIFYMDINKMNTKGLLLCKDFTDDFIETEVVYQKCIEAPLSSDEASTEEPLPQ